MTTRGSQVGQRLGLLLNRGAQTYAGADQGNAARIVALLWVLSGLLALAFARRARRETALRLGRTSTREGVARAGRLLGIVGLCVASAAIVALAVYELLQYAGTRG